MEQFIKYGTAKLANDAWSDMYKHTNFRIFSDGHIGDMCGCYLYRDEEPVPVCTQSVLQKWFRDEHNLHCAVYRLNNKWTYQVYDIIRGCYVTNNHQTESYENALELCLMESLRLIYNNYGRE